MKAKTPPPRSSHRVRHRHRGHRHREHRGDRRTQEGKTGENKEGEGGLTFVTRKDSTGWGGWQLDLRRSYLSVGADVRRGKAMKIVSRTF